MKTTRVRMRRRGRPAPRDPFDAPASGGGDGDIALVFACSSAIDLGAGPIAEFFPSDDNPDASNILVESVRQWFMHLENAPMGASVTWSSVWDGGEAELVLVEDGGVYATVFHGGGGVAGTLTVTANHEGIDYIATIEFSAG